MASLEERFEMLKKVMVENLNTLHDCIMDHLDESEDYYVEFGKTFDFMVEAVEAI